MKQTPLQHIGLSPAAANIYELLLEHGPLPASRISRLSGVERSLSYVVLNDLIEKKLVTKDTNKKVARFTPQHPQHLESLVAEQKQQAQNAEASLNAVFHQLQQQFEMQSGQPGVRFFSGTEGLKYTNQQMQHIDIDEMLLIRSNRSSKEITGYGDLIQTQRTLRIKQNIPLKVIAPSVDFIKHKISDDEKNLTERRIIAKEMFDMPAQVLIYGNTVSLTTYKEPMLTTIIEHEAIAITMKTLFMYVWRSSLAETQQFIKKFSEIESKLNRTKKS